MSNLRPYAYPVGMTVTGATAAGHQFSGVVVATPGPFTVLLDGTHYTPVSLITSATVPAKPAKPVPVTGGQLPLF